ncbi:MAG: hypothetical protein ACR2P2_14360 [Nakamurella sp.]
MRNTGILGRAVLAALACLMAVGVVGCDSSGSAGNPETPASSVVASAAGPSSAAGWPSELCTLLPAGATKGLTKQANDAATKCFYSAGDSAADLRAVSLTRMTKPVTKDAVDERLASSRSESLAAVTIGGHSGWAWADWTVGNGFVWLNAGAGSVMVIVSDMSKDKAVNLAAAKDLAGQLAGKLPA